MNKIDMLKMMDRIARKVNDEDIFYDYWLAYGVPDEATEEDFKEIADTDFSEIEDVFKSLISLASQDGFYNLSQEELEFAKQYDPLITNITDNIESKDIEEEEEL